MSRTNINTMNKAIIIGSLNMDIVAYVKDHPKIGETIFGSDVKYFSGGKGLNQAVACKRLGCETLMVGRIGNDTFGEQLLAFQRGEGIDSSSIKQVDGIATGTAFITVSENADNSIVVITGANAVWEDDFLDSIEIHQEDVVLAQFEVPDNVISKAFAKAKAAGATTLLNPAPLRKISDDIKENTDILIVNEIELSALSDRVVNIDDDKTVFDAIHQIGRTGYQSVVTTLGNKGVRLLNAGEQTSITAQQVSAVDTTGAGDTFIGGLTSGLLAKQTLERAAVLGNFAASISVTREGAANSIPTLSEVKAAMQEK